MTMARVRFVVAALLFVGWIVFLGYLVIRSRSTPVLAVPQIRSADLVVIAELRDDGGAPAPTVTVKQVAWSSARQRDADLQGTEIAVTFPTGADAVKGYVGVGRYIVPLRRPNAARGEPTYRLVPGPIYRATLQAEEQLDAILKQQ